MVLSPAKPSHQRVQNSPLNKYRKLRTVRNWVKLTSAKKDSTQRRMLQVTESLPDFWRNFALITPRRWSSQHQYQSEDSGPVRLTSPSFTKPAQSAAGRPTSGPPSRIHSPCFEWTAWPSASSAPECCYTCCWFTRRRSALRCSGQGSQGDLWTSCKAGHPWDVQTICRRQWLGGEWKKVDSLEITQADMELSNSFFASVAIPPSLWHSW